MKNLTFHIVGLTHNDVKGHEVEYAKEAEGRTICLVPDDANTFDMLAVKAYDKQQLIGYVSALEGEDVRALIIARKERNLRYMMIRFMMTGNTPVLCCPSNSSPASATAP